MSFNPALIAAVGTFVSAGGFTTIVSHFFNKSKVKNDIQNDMQREMRQDLQKQIDDLRTDIKSLDMEKERIEAQVDEWRTKYYDLRDEFAQVSTELQIAIQKIKSQDDKNNNHG